MLDPDREARLWAELFVFCLMLAMYFVAARIDAESDAPVAQTTSEAP